MSVNNRQAEQLKKILSSLDSWFYKWSDIERARDIFFKEDNPAVLSNLRNEIIDSWIRSKKQNEPGPNQAPNKLFLSDSQLSKVLKDNKKLLETAEPILRETAYFFSMTNCFGIGLLDSRGILISIYNYPYPSLRPGLNLTEERAGTSAVSLSLKKNEPAYLLGPEIYSNALRLSKFVASVPIYDQNDNLVAFVVAPYYQKLEITPPYKEQLTWLVSWQFSLAQKIEEALRQNNGKIFISPSFKLADQNNREETSETITVFKDILGISPAIIKTKEIAQKVARSQGNILLTGESGTGKELFARAIHNEYCRQGPFVAINCGAMPSSLIESELFGYEGGSFTGAEKRGRIGKIEMANGGTLFLDEIGDLPISLQPVFLRVLEDKKVTRIGGHGYQQVSFRVIAATNKNLNQLIREEKFRQDLYFRLAALKIDIPPLKERKSDIPYLVRQFIEETCAQLNMRPMPIEKEAADALINYHWPGNIRELKNCILWAVTVAEERITLEDLPIEIVNNPDIGSTSLLKQKMLESEKETINKVMLQTNHNISKAAKILGISRPTLYSKLEIYGLRNTTSK